MQPVHNIINAGNNHKCHQGGSHQATDHGKRFLVTMAVTLLAGGFYYFRGLSLGIDLKGGAELRYQLDTSAIDKEKLTKP